MEIATNIHAPKVAIFRDLQMVALASMLVVCQGPLIADEQPLPPPRVVKFDSGHEVEFVPVITRINSQKKGILRVRLARDDRDVFFFHLSRNVQGAPVVRINKRSPRKPEYIGEIPAQRLELRGDGMVYASSRSGEMFTKHRRYLVAEDRVMELQQPYYHVGLHTKLNQPVVLSSVRGGGDVVIVLPAREKIEVVVNSGPFYLVRAANGVTGWMRVDREPCDSRETIEGLCVTDPAGQPVQTQKLQH